MKLAAFKMGVPQRCAVERTGLKDAVIERMVLQRSLENDTFKPVAIERRLVQAAVLVKLSLSYRFRFSQWSTSCSL